jgi:amino acid transporter
MFKKVFIFLIFVFCVFLLYTPALAQDYGVGAFSQSAGYSTSNQNVYQIIDTIISAFLSVIAILLFVIVFYSGINWMTAAGNEEKVTKAKTTIEAAAVGLAIILAAYGITYFVFSRLV